MNISNRTSLQTYRHYSIQYNTWIIEESTDNSIIVYRLTPTKQRYATYYGHQEGFRNMRRGHILKLEVQAEITDERTGTTNLLIRSTSSTGAVHDWMSNGIFVCIVVPSQPV